MVYGVIECHKKSLKKFIIIFFSKPFFLFAYFCDITGFKNVTDVVFHVQSCQKSADWLDILIV